MSGPGPLNPYVLQVGKPTGKRLTPEERRQRTQAMAKNTKKELEKEAQAAQEAPQA